MQENPVKPPRFLVIDKVTETIPMVVGINGKTFPLYKRSEAVAFCATLSKLRKEILGELNKTEWWEELK